MVRFRQKMVTHNIGKNITTARYYLDQGRQKLQSMHTTPLRQENLEEIRAHLKMKIVQPG